MGLLFIQAVQFADIPVMAAYLCLIGLIFVVINLVVDMLYYLGRSAPADRALGRRGALMDAVRRFSTATSTSASSNRRSP
jgi:peptide/nickel transport system permease protein